MHSIFSDYSKKISPTGRDGTVACQSDFFEDTYEDAMEYELVKLTKSDNINSNLYDSWIYSNSSYKKLISEKTIIFPPSMETNQSLIFSGQYVRPQRQSGTWLITSSDKQYLNKMKGVITECTEVLKWYNHDGVLLEYPASIVSSSILPPLDEDKYMALTKGKILGKVQLNDDTALIEEGDEFIIGNTLKKAKYRLSFEDDFESDSLMVFSLERYQINPEIDNVELQIANYVNRPRFTLILEPITAQLSVGESVQLEYKLLDKDNIESDKPITWSSENENIATVDNNGIVTAITNGNVNIVAQMTNNFDVNDSIGLEVTATPVDNFEINVANGDTSIRRTDTQTFIWNKTNNGVVVPSLFTFTIDSSTSASEDDYVFTVIDGNTYSIKCINEGETLVINVLENGGLSKQIEYELISYWG